MFGSGSNDLGFGVGITLHDGYSAPARVVGASMDNLSAKVEEGTRAASNSFVNWDTVLDNNAKKIQQSTAMMGTGLGLFAAGVAMLAPVGLGLSVAAEFEKSEAGLTTLLKSAEAAKDVMAKVKEDAAKSTMFGFKDLLLGNQLLISTGMEAEKARGDINALADAIAATGGGSAELQRMSVNLQQIRSVGKASAMDIKQFAFAGIDIYGVLADSLGKTVPQVKELDITYDMLTEALKHATTGTGRFQGANERMSETLAGKWAGMMDQIQFTLAEIGMAVKPFVTPIIDIFTILIKGIAAFAGTGIGKVVLGVAIATGILLVVSGGLLMVMGALRGAAFKLSTNFITMGATEIGAAFATGSLTAGFFALATAVWAALLPLLPFIAAGVAIVAIGYGIYKALTSANEKFVIFGTIIGILLGPIGQLITGIIYLTRGIREFREIMAGTREAQGGFIGFMQKLGGIVLGVAEIFNSWNGSTFELSEEMHNALQKTGILQFVLNLGTWVVRIKEFMKGFVSPFVEAWDTVSALFSKVAQLFDPIIVAVTEWGGVIEKATGSTNLWNSAGEMMGNIFTFMFFPIIAVINAITFLIDLILDFEGTMGRVMDGAKSMISDLGDTFGVDLGLDATNNVDNISEANSNIVKQGLDTGSVKNSNEASQNTKTNTKETRVEPQLIQPNLSIQIGDEQIYGALLRMQNDKDSRN